MSDACFLILDQGGQSSRALVINAAGQTLVCESMMVATQTPAADEVEQDPEQLVTSLQLVAGAAVAQLTPEQRQQLLSAGLVTQRSGSCRPNLIATGYQCTPVQDAGRWQLAIQGGQAALQWMSNSNGPGSVAVILRGNGMVVDPRGNPFYRVGSAQCQ